MEILQNGKGFTEREYIENCKICGCKFKYKEKEVIRGSDAVSKKYKNGRVDYVNCPQCKNQLFVDNRGKPIEELELERKVSAAFFQFKLDVLIAIILLVVSLVFRLLLLFICDLLLLVGSIISLIYWLVLKKKLSDYKKESQGLHVL